MARSTPLEDSLLFRLSTFRPSDRDEFKKAFETPDGVRDAQKAVTRFIEGWEDRQWVESYSIERIAKWLATNAPETMVASLSLWASVRNTNARQALRKGFRMGKKLAAQDQAFVGP